MPKKWNLIEGTRDDVLKVHDQLINEIDGDPDSDEAVCISTCIECGAVFERTDGINEWGQDYEHFSQKHPGDGFCCPQELPKTILSLCDYSGHWSQPYVDAGYDVIRVDLQHGQDVRTLEYPGEVWGVLAAPPCTVFCRPGARLWKQWPAERLLDGLALVDACLRFVAICRPRWWALENPPGRLDKYLGPPTLSFHPWHFGDPYTKHTYLWGRFTLPVKTPVEPEPYPEHLPPGQRDRTSFLGSANRNKRAETPPGFAKAFFLANP